MPRYAVLKDYGSGTCGPWSMGTQVELTEAEAEWVNRDSAGTLAEVRSGVQLEMGQPVPPEKLKGYVPPLPPATLLPTTPEKPAGNASHEAWAAYAVARGGTVEEVETLSRDELRELYRGDD